MAWVGLGWVRLVGRGRVRSCPLACLLVLAWARLSGLSAFFLFVLKWPVFFLYCNLCTVISPVADTGPARTQDGCRKMI